MVRGDVAETVTRRDGAVGVLSSNKMCDLETVCCAGSGTEGQVGGGETRGGCERRPQRGQAYSKARGEGSDFFLGRFGNI